MNRKWDKIDTNIVSKYITAEKRRCEIKKMLNAGRYPAQISGKLGLKLTTTYGLIRQINSK